MAENTVLNEFKDFIFSQNFTQFLLATVFTSTMYPVISDLVGKILLPIIGMYLFKVDFKDAYFTLRNQKLYYGSILSNIVTLVISIIIIFFLLVKPFSHILKERREQEKQHEKETEIKAVNLLESIEKKLNKSIIIA